MAAYSAASGRRTHPFTGSVQVHDCWRMVRQAIDDAILLRSCVGEECESPSIL
jgi:hypothetical protein